TIASAATAPKPAVVAATPAASDTPGSLADRDYVLGPSDVIEVSILGRTDFTTRGRISEDGTIQLPYLGSFPAVGKTTLAFSDAVGQALENGGFFSHPIVKVDIVSYASRYVTVLGDVTTPGLVPVDRPYRLSEILARVGGVRETAAEFVVLRTQKGPERRLSVRELATGDSSQDPYVSPGDKIYAPKAEIFYISGQVNAPGSYQLSPDMTVRMAIARGGGINAEGTDKKVTITRKGVKAKISDLNAKIEPGDIVIIGERLF
ncbi:MAG: SLBB domain-containing protein, partial [Caulobacteraceae bacterium]